MGIQKQMKCLVFLSIISGSIATANAQESPDQYLLKNDPGVPAPNASQIKRAVQLGNHFTQLRWYEFINRVSGSPIPQRYLDRSPEYSSRYFQDRNYSPVRRSHYQHQHAYPGTDFPSWRPPSFHSTTKGHKP